MVKLWTEFVEYVKSKNAVDSSTLKQYRTPFFGAFIFYILVYNWRLVLTLLITDYGESRKEKFFALETLTNDYNWLSNVGIPILFALGSLVLYYSGHGLSLFVTAFYHKRVKPRVYKTVGFKQATFSREEVESMVNENARLKELNNKYRKEIDSLEGELADTRDQINAEAEEQTTGYITQIDQLQNDLERTKNNSSNQVERLSSENRELREQLADYDYHTDVIFKEPKLIDVSGLNIPSEFLLSQTGSVSVWINVPSLEELVREPANHRYVIGHDTNKGIRKALSATAFDYENGWGFNLAPDQYDGSRKLPTKVWWQLWFSNDKLVKGFLNLSELSEKDSGWHHFLIRWNHIVESLEILVDGKVKGRGNQDYYTKWPKKTAKSVEIGNWPTKEKKHNLGMPLYRLIITTDYLPNIWLRNELNNRPSSS